jgi:hypothetical protein
LEKVLIASLKTKMHVISPEVAEGLQKAVTLANMEFRKLTKFPQREVDRVREAAADYFEQYLQIEEILEKSSRSFALLAIRGGDTGFLKEGFKIEALGDIQRRHIDIETRYADLVLRQSRGQNGGVIQSRAEISCDNEKEESSIDGVLWPSKRSGLELIANLLALLAGTHGIQDAPAHGVRCGIASMADE